MSTSQAPRSSTQPPHRTKKVGLSPRPTPIHRGLPDAEPYAHTSLVLVLDSDGQISDYVEGDPALLVALPRLGVGKTVRHVFPADFAGSIMEAHGRAAEGELVTSLQCSLPTKAGTRKFVVWSSQVTSWTVTCVPTPGATCTGFCALSGGATYYGDRVSVPPGFILTITIAAHISLSATGSGTNTASISAPAGTTDPDPGNNSLTFSNNQ